MTEPNPTPLPVLRIGAEVCRDPNQSFDREWLVANGIGGYASGTVGGAATRRYHGLLVAALTPPTGRTVLLASLEETVEVEGRHYRLDSHEYHDGTLYPRGFALLKEFRLEGGLPVWTFDLDGATVERRVWMARGRNTVFVSYRLVGGAHLAHVTVAPLVCFRDYHGETTGRLDWHMPVTTAGQWQRIAVTATAPPLSLRFAGESAARIRAREDWYWRFLHRRERERGLDHLEDLYCPCELSVNMTIGGSAVLTATVERPGPDEADPIGTLARELARRSHLLAQAGAERSSLVRQHLVLASDAFVVERRGRSTGVSVIAGYHWFTDWGRDTMISLPGLCLATGRHSEAREILRTFARVVDQGMLPNYFPDDGTSPIYNAVDATLWFFHALDAYLAATGDTALLVEQFPKLEEIMGWYLQGTRYGIGEDPEDGLLHAGTGQEPLTWMDARVHGWPVTPRHGKPVEVQALWYHALRCMERWTAHVGQAGAHPYRALAEQVARSFNQRFWNAEAGCLYDVVDGPDGDDPTVRPNQLFAVALPDAVLDPTHWPDVVRVVAERLLTPLGVRTQAPGTPGYMGHYGGDQFQRDTAYHRGTAWPWLLGAFTDAQRRAFPDSTAAPSWLVPLADHLHEAGVGTVSEVFDGDAPHAPGGCIAQAWSVAELLRLLSQER